MSAPAAEKTPKRKSGGLLSGLFSGEKRLWVVSSVMALIAAGSILSILGSAAASTTYYVLNRDIPARTMITTSMLTPLQAKVGEEPPNAYDLVFVRDNEVFSKVPLGEGDIVGPSTVGPLERINRDLPPTFVAASLAVSPENAVAGKIRAGDFVDILAVTEQSSTIEANVALHHVLVLDVTVAPDSIAVNANDGQEGDDLGVPGPESEAVRGGIPSVYTFGLSPEDATTLAVLGTGNYAVSLALSGWAPEESIGDAEDSSAGTFESTFIKRWTYAFEPNTTYVEHREEVTDCPTEHCDTVWIVNDAGQWTDGTTTLDPGDTPAGYLEPPMDMQYTDSEGTFWYVTKNADKQRVWYAPKDNIEAAPGDYPPNFDPLLPFQDNLMAATAPQGSAPTSPTTSSSATSTAPSTTSASPSSTESAETAE